MPGPPELLRALDVAGRRVVAPRLARRACGLVSVELPGGPRGVEVAVVEEPPVGAAIPETAPEELVRSSVGLENAEDLIEDLEQALAPG